MLKLRRFQVIFSKIQNSLFSKYTNKFVYDVYISLETHSKTEPGSIFMFFFVSCFVMSVYLSPLLGGYISDTFWGKYKTIITFSILYTASAILLSFSTVVEPSR